LCTTANAQYHYVIDGINYDCSPYPAEAKVMSKSYKYSGTIKIPSTVLVYTTVCKVVAIKQNAFSDCVNLTSVSIPNSIKTIGANAFKNCTKLTSIEIPNSVTNIEKNTFSGCSSLTNVIIPNSITTIADYAFSDCSELKEIVIPENVVSIGANAFEGCTNLENIYFYSNPTLGADAIPATAKCHLILNDEINVNFDTANANTYTDASYTRTISEGRYETIILPFTPDAVSLENYAFYELVESSEEHIKFDEVAEPVANTPYIYTLREGKENVAITGGETTISSTIKNSTVDGWKAIGSFDNQTIDINEGNYYTLSDSANEVSRITNNLTVLPYRAYFISDNVSNSSFNIYINSTTGIIETPLNKFEDFKSDEIFDLNGRKVIYPIKGKIYISNGKKIIF
jgi:hypothetical protein